MPYNRRVLYCVICCAVIEKEPGNEVYPTGGVLGNGEKLSMYSIRKSGLHFWADTKGNQKIERIAAIKTKRIEIIDDESVAAAKEFIKKQVPAYKQFIFQS